MGFVVNPFTGQLDVVGTGGGGGGPTVQVPNYQQLFNSTSDWSGPSGGVYTISILASTHGKGLKPLVQVWELNGSNYNLLGFAVIISPTGTITLEVIDSPDNRFAGKILVSENN